MSDRLLDEVERLSGQQGELCYHCHKCTAGCPVVDAMEYGPDLLLRMVSLDQTDAILKSRDVWLCTGCYTCATRCPNDIDIAAAMDGVVGPKLAIEMGRFGGLAVLNLEGLQTRYDDTEGVLEEIAGLFEEKVVDHLMTVVKVADKKVTRDELMADDEDEAPKEASDEKKAAPQKKEPANKKSANTDDAEGSAEASAGIAAISCKHL